MRNVVQALGHATLNRLAGLGRAFSVLLQAVFTPRGAGAKLSLLWPEIFSAGVLSLLIIAVSGLFIGMVLALQGYSILVDFGSEQSLGQLVSLTLLRELGPVVTALLFAGRAGSAMTAEIGLMKATEQLASSTSNPTTGLCLLAGSARFAWLCLLRSLLSAGGQQLVR